MFPASTHQVPVTPILTTKHVFRYCRVSSGGRNLPWLRQTDRRDCRGSGSDCLQRCKQRRRDSKLAESLLWPMIRLAGKSSSGIGGQPAPSWDMGHHGNCKPPKLGEGASEQWDGLGKVTGRQQPSLGPATGRVAVGQSQSSNANNIYGRLLRARCWF